MQQPCATVDKAALRKALEIKAGDSAALEQLATEPYDSTAGNFEQHLWIRNIIKEQSSDQSYKASMDDLAKLFEQLKAGGEAAQEVAQMPSTEDVMRIALVLALHRAD